KPKSMNVKLEFHKREDGTWVYRNLTTLHVQIGAEQFVIVDANGNGSYCDSRVDGIAWEGRTWLFPLPGEYERWCSATMDFVGLRSRHRGSLHRDRRPDEHGPRARPLLAGTLSGAGPDRRRDQLQPGSARRDARRPVRRIPDHGVLRHLGAQAQGVVAKGVGE